VTAQDAPDERATPWQPAAWVAIGQIVKVHGVRGEVEVLPLSPLADRFAAVGRVYASAAPADRLELTVVSSRPVARGVLLRFAGYDSREAALPLCGRLLEVPRAEARHIPEGEALFADMIGLLAYDAASGEAIGSIIAIVSAGNDLLEIATPRGVVLVPWVPDFVERPDLARGTVAIKPIPGLLDPS
jgi:16S rRNA processing protein RimM